MKTREIPTKNYIVTLVVAAATVVLTLTFAINYRNKVIYNNENIMTTFLSEIKTEELDTYITENHDVMIYLISDNIEDEIQQKAKKIITKNDFIKDMVVLNINVDEELISNLKNKYFNEQFKNVDLEENNILFIKEGKIVDILNVDLENIKDLKKYINTNFYGV